MFVIKNKSRERARRGAVFVTVQRRRLEFFRSVLRFSKHVKLFLATDDHSI